MIEKVSENIWKIKADGNLYFLNLDEKVVIDTGSRANRSMVEQFLSKLVDFRDVRKVIFTHLHYDHIGNFDLFKNAEFFASGQEIRDFKDNPYNTILDEDMVSKFKVELKPLPKKINCLSIINTPGHTRGSVCIWYNDEKILFSGDTLLKKDTGRTDLPTSAPAEIHNSVMKLLKLNHKKLCTGHEY